MSWASKLVRVALLVAVVAAGFVTASASADPTEPNGGDLVEECRAETSSPMCRQFEQLTRVGAQLCRFAGVDERACSAIDGREYSEAAVQEFEAGWVHGALRLQEHLDDHLPIGQALIPATHNSNNAAAYAPTLSGLDHNQVATITDQLRMGMQGLELDLHWFPSPHGEPEHGGFAPILCHGQSQGFGPATVHIGCTAERHLRDGLAEIDAWLDDHPDDVLLLYLENQLDDDPVAHDAAAATLAEVIGDHVYPTGGGCAPLPYDRSQADVLAAGKQVLLVGNAGAATTDWCALVHERSGHGQFAWAEDKSPAGDDFDCGTDRAEFPRDETFRRFYEDSTWLSFTVEPTGAGSPGKITVAETDAMVRCGVNLFGFDQLLPADPRLEALVWSWAPGEPTGGGAAYQGADGRFHRDGLGTPRAVACRTADGWHVATGGQANDFKWQDGQAACDAAFPGSDFAVPATGADNAALSDAKAAAGVDEVWIDYRKIGGAWTPNP